MRIVGKVRSAIKRAALYVPRRIAVGLERGPKLEVSRLARNAIQTGSNAAMKELPPGAVVRVSDAEQGPFSSTVSCGTRQRARRLRTILAWLNICSWYLGHPLASIKYLVSKGLNR